MDCHDIATQMPFAADSTFPRAGAYDQRKWGDDGQTASRTLGLLAALPTDDIEATLSEFAFDTVVRKNYRRDLKWAEL
jgi:hypothetical protein